MADTTYRQGNNPTQIDTGKVTSSNTEYVLRNTRPEGTVKEYVNTLEMPHKPDYDGKIPLPAFAGCDIVTTFIIDGQPYSTYNITTLSIDTNRGITPVPTLGRIEIRRFARGHRFIAGTITFLTTVEGPMPFFGPNTIFNQTYERNTALPAVADQNIATLYSMPLDTIPPFDILISYMDEYGRMSHERLFGVVLYREQKVASINDLVTEVQCQYFAMSRDNMRGSTNQHIYKTGISDKVAENMVVLNNFTAMRYQKYMLEQTLNKMGDEDSIDDVRLSYLTNPDTSSVGVYTGSINKTDLIQMIADYDKSLANISYQQDENYEYGLRQYLTNSDYMPNI